MARGKHPVRLSGLTGCRAPMTTLHPQSGQLPGAFVLEFTKASGLAGLSDGRALMAALTPAELARVLGAVPALSMDGDDEDIQALVRIIGLLKGAG